MCVVRCDERERAEEEGAEGEEEEEKNEEQKRRRKETNETSSKRKHLTVILCTPVPGKDVEYSLPILFTHQGYLQRSTVLMSMELR